MTCMKSRRRNHAFCYVFIVPSLILASVVACGGQAKDRIAGEVFRSDAIGLTYTFPAAFSPKIASEIPGSTSAVETLILALWSTPDRIGPPRMSFLYDKKIRPAGRTRQQMADRYLGEIKQMWVGVRGAKITGPEEISPAGYLIWRINISQPDNSPHYISAIAIPLPDRRILVIQANAPSQGELDAELNSLKDLHFDRKF
jgi:hypothetical protein